MPSNTASGPKLRSIKPGNDLLRGTRYRVVPDFTTRVPFAAADLSGATSGFFVMPVVADCVFLGVDFIWKTAGTNTLRVKKIPAASVQAAGAAADANNIDLTAVVDLTTAANTVVSVAPVTTGFVNKCLAGDKIAIASAAGTASLAGAVAVLRFAYV